MTDDYHALEGLTNDQLVTWAAQVLSDQRSKFSERVEARSALTKLVEQADAYRGAVEERDSWRRLYARQVELTERLRGDRRAASSASPRQRLSTEGEDR